MPESESRAPPRNLVICCDGTNNEFGRQNTNVVRLVQVLERDSARQIVHAPADASVLSRPGARQQVLYYDPGVGTLPEPGLFTRIGKNVSRVLGLAFGTGLVRNIEEAYAFLMEHWEPGDRVFLFGFSRGAYTVRVLAELLHALGLLPRGNHNLVPYVRRLFQAVRNRREGDDKSWYWRLCDEFRWTFARPVSENDDERRFRVHFLGVWDTVSSVGWVWDPVKFPFTVRNPSTSIVRHAIAIDERRWFFRQNRMEQKGERQDFRELWFPGVHADVGGGYAEVDRAFGLWRMPFEWMLGEAEAAGLRVNEERRRTALSRTTASERPWNDQQHESLTWKWWPAEFFPKLQRLSPGGKLRLPRIGLGRRRFVQPGALIQRSALLRIRETEYAPSNLSAAFREKVRGLKTVPAALAYEP